MNTIEKVLYTAKVHTTGGRDGASRSSDGHLDVKLSTPGATGTGTNPEQLFAAGWSACFMSAIGLLAAQRKIMLSPDRYIDVEVDLGTNAEGFLLARSAQRPFTRLGRRGRTVAGGRGA